MAGHGNPSISVRKYIKWGDGIASEPTSTLVLTSPQRQFVDVRILLPVPGGLTGPRVDSISIRDPEQLDWAFAGTSSHDGDATPPHSVFRHWVDSRYADAEAVRDEGDMVPSGREGEDIERGGMVNPATGRMEMYEECWVDGLKRGQDSGKAGWVLKCEGKNGDARGMMIRIGTIVQGVLRVGDAVAVGRWEVGLDGHGVKVLVPVVEIGELCGGFPAVELLLLLDSWGLGKMAESRDGERSWSCVESWSD